MSGTQNAVIVLPAGTDQFPFVVGGKISSAAVNNALIALQNQINSYAKLVSQLQAQIASIDVVNNNYTLNYGPTSGNGNGISSGEYTLLFTSPYEQTIVSMDYSVGNNGGSFEATVLINGAVVGGLYQVYVNSSTKNTTSATLNNTLPAGGTLSVLLSNIVGEPENWILSVNCIPVTTTPPSYADLTTEAGGIITDELGNPILVGA